MADSLRCWITRSAMDDTCVFRSLFLTLSAIDSDSGVCLVGDLTISFGGSTINCGASLESNWMSLFALMLNCTLGGATICTLGDASVCTLGGALLLAFPSGSWFLGWSAVVSCLMASICELLPGLLPGLLFPLITFVKSWIAFIIRSSVVSVGCVICLCLKKTVSEIRFALVALTKI